MKPEIKYIGKQITIEALKDFIVDTESFKEKVILLNSQNFDDIVLEHRDFYGESMEVPFYLIGVLITEDETKKVPLNRIGVINEVDYEQQNLI